MICMPISLSNGRTDEAFVYIEFPCLKQLHEFLDAYLTGI